MAETSSTRFGFTIWGAPTDGPSRLEFNAAWTALETYAAKDTQGLFAARPAAGEAQRYYYATDTGVLYRDNGTTWKVVGSVGIDETLSSSATSAVPLTINAVAGQTANLLTAQVNAVDKFTVNKDGDVAAGTVTGGAGSFTTTDAAVEALKAKGAAAQTAKLLSLQTSAATEVFAVGPLGSVTGAYLSASDGKGIVGGSSYVTMANQTRFTGVTPALEVRSTIGGAGTFQDLLSIRHPLYDATPVARRLGIQLKIGDEVLGDATKAGGMYLDTSAASAADPSLVLFQGDSAALTIPASAGSIVANSRGLTAEGTVDVNKTGAASLRFNTDVALGAQGDSLYSRVKTTSDSFYWYGGGSHSDSPGDESTGTEAMSLTGAGLLTVPRLNITSTADASLAQASPALMIGAASSGNLIFDAGPAAEIMARNNGAVAELLLNGDGGDISLGGATAAVVNTGSGVAFKINGKQLSIQTSAPSSPSTGDIWFDI